MTALEAERLKEQNPAYEGRPTYLSHFKTSLDRFSKRMSEMTGERGGFSGKERTRRLFES
jgi:hypothetical protein